MKHGHEWSDYRQLNHAKKYIYYNQHRKYQINLLNVFKVYNKDTRLMMSVDANWFFLLLILSTFSAAFGTLI